MPAGLWARFEHDVAAWVATFARSGIQFCAGRTRIPGFPSSGFRADALLTDGDVLVAVEVEVRQTHPDTNVGKYWLLSKYHQYRSVTLFHIYTPAFDSYGWRMELGKFYAEQMQRALPFRYLLMDHRQDTDPPATLESVKLAIGPSIVSAFSAVQ